MKMLRMIILDCCALLTFLGTTALGIYMEIECSIFYYYWERAHHSLFAFQLLYAGTRSILVFGGVFIIYMVLTRQKEELFGKSKGK